MRLTGVAMVRNEVDVIEAFVRHNLTVLDGLSIVDHGSFDGTTEILARLRAEGLPLRVTQDPDPAYRQSETMTSLAREALTRDGADFAFALDADEFLKIESRTALERVLSAVPEGMHVAMHWLTYVPGAFENGGFGPGHLWWRLETERQGLSKVIVSRALLARPTDVIAMGNHAVVSGTAGTVQRHARPSQDTVALAHCPVRSRAQFESKIIVGYLANLAAQRTDRLLARHWRELYNELRAGGTFGEERLREIASNYGLPMKKWRPSSEIGLVEDPVPLAADQRYSGTEVCDPLRTLLRFTELLVDEERAYLAGPSPSEATTAQYVTL
jgi:glycosyl transferase family 2